MVKQRLLCLAFSLWLLSPQPLAASGLQGCGGAGATIIRVTPVDDETRYDNSQSIGAMRELANQGNGSGESWPVGLATSKPFFSMNSEMVHLTKPSQQLACTWLKAVTVEMGLADNKIYVTSAFPPDSCPYNTVLEHEEKHKAVDRQVLQEYLPQMQQMLETVTASIGIIHTLDIAEAEAAITRQLNEALDQFSKTMEADRTRRQQAVDSPEEYQRIGTSCHGELAAILGQAVQNPFLNP